MIHVYSNNSSPLFVLFVVYVMYMYYHCYLVKAIHDKDNTSICFLKVMGYIIFDHNIIVFLRLDRKYCNQQYLTEPMAALAFCSLHVKNKETWCIF